MHHQPQHMMPLHQWGVSKYKQGYPTKDRPLSTKDRHLGLLPQCACLAAEIVAPWRMERGFGITSRKA